MVSVLSGEGQVGFCNGSTISGSCRNLKVALSSLVPVRFLYAASRPAVRLKICADVRVGRMHVSARTAAQTQSPCFFMTVLPGRQPDNRPTHLNMRRGGVSGQATFS